MQCNYSYFTLRRNYAAELQLRGVNGAGAPGRLLPLSAAPLGGVRARDGDAREREVHPLHPIRQCVAGEQDIGGGDAARTHCTQWHHMCNLTLQLIYTLRVADVQLRVNEKTGL